MGSYLGAIRGYCCALFRPLNQALRVLSRRGIEAEDAGTHGVRALVRAGFEV